MGNGQVQIDEATFKSMDAKARDWMVLMTVHSHIEKCEGEFKTIEVRQAKIETRQKMDLKKMLTVSGITGVVGGILAVIGKMTIFRGSN